jgi:hypothetical protein
MTNTRRNARLLVIVAGVVCVTASITALASAASAMIAPLSGVAPPTRHLARTIPVSPGMPDWQVALITTGAAILGAAVAMLIGWTRTRRLSVLSAS